MQRGPGVIALAACLDQTRPFACSLFNSVKTKTQGWRRAKLRRIQAGAVISCLLTQKVDDRHMRTEVNDQQRSMGEQVNTMFYWVYQ